MTPLDLSSLVPHLAGACATGLIWVAIQFARDAYHGTLSTRSALATVVEGAGYACALSICAVVSAAYAQNLISDGVKQLVILLMLGAMLGAEIARDLGKPQSGSSSGRASEPAKNGG